MLSRVFFSLTIVITLSGTPLPSAAQTQTQTGTQTAPMHLFNGSVDELAACNAEASRLCGSAAADPVKALTCLKNFRRQLSAACAKALNQHGL